MEHLDPDRYEGMTLQEVKHSQARIAIESAIRRNGYSITKAARELDVTRPGLYDAMRYLEMQRPYPPHKRNGRAAQVAL